MVDNKQQNKEVLLAQYNLYGQLYQHEDNLTWTKVERLVGFSGILVAVLGASLADFDRFWILSLLITLFGSVMSLSFFFSISNGSMFIELRRKCVTNLEGELAELGAVQQLEADKPRLEEIAGRSALGRLASRISTRTMLFWLPILLLCGWVALSMAVVLIKLIGVLVWGA